MIEQEIINAIKTDIDLVSLIESKGIQLKKNGKGYVGLCPFHDEDTPSLSVTPSTNLWNCFGCGKGGDAIRFVELYDKVSFPEAVKSLEGNNFSFNRSKDEPPKTLPTARANELLERTVSIYENIFAENPAARDSLIKRGITDEGLFSHYRIGYCNGTLNAILPDDPQIKEELQTTGILNERNYERFRDCLVVPVFDPDGCITTLYGRHLTERRHVYLPNRPKGLWNSCIIKTTPEVILVESVIDALSVMVAGYPNVISIQSATGLAERDIETFKEHGVRKIILLLDGDDAGTNASRQLKEKLFAYGVFTVEVKTLPDGHDPNSFLTEFGAEKLAERISMESEPEEPEPDDSSEPKPTPEITPALNGFILKSGPRKYRVIGLDKTPRKLRATIRVEHGGRLHADTIDFYSSRARKSLAQDLCRIFDEVPQTIETDITRLMLACENAPEPDSSETAPVTMSDKDRREARQFGKSKDLTDRILTDLTTCGLIGENANKLLGYIVMTSRKLAKPLAMFILSSSGAGKTALQDAVTSLCPPEDLVKLTSLSGKALFYKDRESLKHKVLSIEEGDGAGEAMYAIRNLISAGVLVSESTIKDLSTGKLTTMENRVEGPTSVFLTTTNPNTDPETMSRFFVTGIDESRDQTRRILAYQRKTHMAASIDPEKDALHKRHHNFQRLLKSITVKNPYKDQLTYGDDRLQGRRDQPKYLQLILAVCFLRQMQKKINHETRDGKKSSYINVDSVDITIATHLANEILGRSLDELSRPGRDLLMLLDEMVEVLWQKHHKNNQECALFRTDIIFSRRDIREYTGWANTRVHRYMKELTDLEYVLVESGRNGALYRYRLAYEGQGKKGEKFMLGLTPMENLTKVNEK